MRTLCLIYLASSFICFQLLWAGETQITASDASVNDRFGRSVAISNNDLIGGASRDDGTGSAYIYTLSGGVWNEIAKLTPNDGVNFDDFGLSVAIDGDYAVVGAPEHPRNAGRTGAAYVFCRDSGGTDNWGQVAKLTASNAATNDRFGEEFAVGISGDYIVVGARRVDSTGIGTDIGAAYIYERPQSGWTDATEDTQLVASDATGGDQFGLGIAIDSNKVLIGASQDNGARGSVYFFYRDVNGNWNEQQNFTPASRIVDAEFGKTIAIDEHYAVIGSPNSIQPDSGLAYIFQYNSGTNSWSEQAILLPHDRRDYNRFGNAVAIDSNLVLIGAWEDSSTYGINSGLAYAFLRTGSSWQEVSQFIASDGGIDYRYGISVALHNNYALIGAPQDGKSGTFFGTGAVYSQKVDLFVDIALWLEGPYSTSGDTMSTAINDSIPFNNPYSDSAWNYTGGDSIGVIRDTIVDWVLVELRTGSDASTAVDSCAAFISKSGKIVGVSGSGALPLDVSAGNYYIAVRHRNHLAVMTANAVTLSSRSLNSYDFTTGTGQYFGGDAKQLETGVFGMYAGDGNQSGIVTISDKNDAFFDRDSVGYLDTDYNLSGIVTISDSNVAFLNRDASTQVP